MYTPCTELPTMRQFSTRPFWVMKTPMPYRKFRVRAAAAAAAIVFLSWAASAPADQFDALWDLPSNEEFLADFMMAYPDAPLTGRSTCAGGPGFSPDYRTSLVFAANGHLAYKAIMLFSKKDGKPVPFRPDAMLKSFEKYETGEKDTSRIFYRFPNRLTGVYDYARTGNNGIIIGMRMGMFTPSEGGAVAVIYCFIVGGLFYRKLNLKKHFIPILMDTIAGTSSVVLIMVSASVFGQYLSWVNIPKIVATAILNLTSNKFVFLMLCNLVLLIMGMFLEGGACLMITTPLLLPVAQKLGVDTIHFGLVMIVNIMVGGITPPFGSMMFTTCGITGCPIRKI